MISTSSSEDYFWRIVCDLKLGIKLYLWRLYGHSWVVWTTMWWQLSQSTTVVTEPNTIVAKNHNRGNFDRPQLSQYFWKKIGLHWYHIFHIWCTCIALFQWYLLHLSQLEVDLWHKIVPIFENCNTSRTSISFTLPLDYLTFCPNLN